VRQPLSVRMDMVVRPVLHVGIVVPSVQSSFESLKSLRTDSVVPTSRPMVVSVMVTLE
jgi:hypothetical protein